MRSEGEILERLVVDNAFFRNWERIEHYLRTHKRCSVKTWIIAHEILDKARTRRGVRRGR